LKLWEVATGSELRTFSGHAETVHTAAFAPDGRTILSGSSDKTLRLWETASGRQLHMFTGHTGDVYSLAFARDGRTALSGSGDFTIKLWDLTGLYADAQHAEAHVGWIDRARSLYDDRQDFRHTASAADGHWQHGRTGDNRWRSRNLACI